MKAAEFLDQHEWCQGTYARDAEGNPRVAHSREAVRFCLIGALLRVYVGDSFFQVRAQITEALQQHPPNWNDAPERTKADVVNLLKELNL